MRIRFNTGLALSLLFVVLAACGSNSGGDGGDSDDSGDSSDGDGGNGEPDAWLVDDGGMGSCMPGIPECRDTCDNDGDGQTDGFDIECTGSEDNDEGSFATGIPGDNRDRVKQDCFFDGNSGSGDDGCEIHVCCILGAPDRASCPIGANQYNPNECNSPQAQLCQTTCEALTPPGCDCFGCCTICDPVTNACFDIITNPATAPLCDAASIGDPNKCPRCVKQASCNNPCDPANCILCPGQTPDDLPPTCNGAVCPVGQADCGAGSPECPSGQYCSNGCCIANIP